MKKHFRYLRYVLRHKWFVFLGCRILGVPLWQALIHDWTKFLPIEWFAYVDRLDRSRNSSWHSVEDTPEYTRAWKHHWSRNPHHWEYWIHTIDLDCPDTNLWIDDYVTGVGDGAPFAGYVVRVRKARGSPPSHYRIRTENDEFWAGDFELLKRVSPMPERYVREMVADWYGAGMAQGKPDIRGWYEANKHRRTLHPATQSRVQELLELLPK